MNTREHVAYLGTVIGGGVIYTGYLYEVGPEHYQMVARSVAAPRGRQMSVQLKARLRTLEAAVTWGVCHMIEYILETGVGPADIHTVHPANAPGVDMDVVMSAIEAYAIERATEEAARATKH